MKYFTTAILITFVSLFSFGQTTVPCENPIPGTSCNPGAPQPEDGNGSLGMTYSNTACGLNYFQSTLMTTTRYSPPGTGFPAPMNVTIPCGANIEQAYVWWSGSGTAGSGADPNFTFNGNPYVGTLIGTGGDKCWNYGGTVAYRYDITALVTGSGVYNFSSAMGDLIDGAMIMVIYTDPSAAYQGTIQINDGNIANNSGGLETQTMTGLNVCANSTYGEAFIVVGDMQDNIAPPTHTNTLNGANSGFPNQFYQFDMANTNFTAGQTTSAFGTSPDGGGDCYAWILMGVYYQTTSCATCTPVTGSLTSNSTFVDASCGNCDGTATANPAGGTGPYTYSWNTVPVQNTQTATNLCAGTYIVTFTDATCLTGADTITISTIAGPAAPVITPTGPYCLGDPALNITVSTVGGTWSGTGITNTANGTFDPTTAGAGSHLIIYVDAGLCPGSDTITIVVNSIADATITPAGPFCPNDPIINLTAVSPGGTWTGTGITNAATGAFSPTIATPGTYTITYEISGSCGDTQTVNITISPFLNATITPTGPYCLVDPSINLAAVDIGGAWSGTGITNAVAGTFDPATAGAGTHTITYGIPGNCGDTQTVNIIVVAALDATITPAGPFCEGDPSAILLPAVDPGGIWSGVGITNTTAGAFDPTTAGAGTHTITYGITGSCGDTQTVNIIVIPDADATITPVGIICVISPAFNLSAVDPNGIWSGTGITNAATGAFDPATAGIGTHTITYTIAGACGDAQTTNITIVAQDDATITPSGPFCVDASSVSLIAATAGGTWSGQGITNPANGTFDPATAGPGVHIITYTTPGVCGNADTGNIIVNPLPVVVFSVDTFSLCETPAQSFTFSTDTTGGMFSSILWNFGDGSTGSSDVITHTYAGPGTYDITLTLTSSAAAGGCTNSLLEIAYVEVYANPVADFTITPNPTSMFDPTVQFIDQSYNNIVSWNWDIGGLQTSIMQNPIYTFPEDTGHYLTILTVIDANGCIDTTSNTAIVIGEFGIYVPNSFTPDGDG
ncbi:MAG: PKD domain-containing protein [Flavobacteriales bacterium]|nr:PKD domain-containing protein [Flavobacteriales bacterium]